MGDAETTTSVPTTVTTVNYPPPEEFIPPVGADKVFYTPLFIVTAFFGAIFIIAPLTVRRTRARHDYSGIIKCSIMIATFCCWIFWVIAYAVQLNPLLSPRLRNDTMAWIGHKWGDNPRTLIPKFGGIPSDIAVMETTSAVNASETTNAEYANLNVTTAGENTGTPTDSTLEGTNPTDETDLSITGP